MVTSGEIIRKVLADPALEALEPGEAKRWLAELGAAVNAYGPERRVTLTVTYAPSPNGLHVD